MRRYLLALILAVGAVLVAAMSVGADGWPPHL
jgi:hypothetical protein